MSQFKEKDTKLGNFYITRDQEWGFGMNQSKIDIRHFF
jgi:hypothetical protein